MTDSEVNISTFAGRGILQKKSRAVIFKLGCFVQKYWSGTVTRNTAMRRAADYLHLNKPNLAAFNYTAAVQCSAVQCSAVQCSENLLNIADVVRSFFNCAQKTFWGNPCRNITTMCRNIAFFRLRAEISLSRNQASLGTRAGPFLGMCRNIVF